MEKIGQGAEAEIYKISITEIDDISKRSVYEKLIDDSKNIYLNSENFDNTDDINNDNNINNNHNKNNNINNSNINNNSNNNDNNNNLNNQKKLTNKNKNMNQEKYFIRKTRIKKNYRIEEIDEELRKSRTKREYNILNKISKYEFSPKVYSKSDYDIEMEYIFGEKLKNEINYNNYKSFMKKIGEDVAILHNNDIIHGDLTTSNMIFNNGKLFFIDFGLSIVSKKIEDKAVDIHLFRQNFESTHNELFKEGFDIFLKNYYKNVENSQEIKNRFEEVEKRGRNKH